MYGANLMPITIMGHPQLACAEGFSGQVTLAINEEDFKDSSQVNAEDTPDLTTFRRKGKPLRFNNESLSRDRLATGPRSTGCPPSF